MTADQQKIDPVTVVVSDVVYPDRVDDYETWLEGINRVVETFEGFLGVDIIRPRDREHPEYVIIVRFDTCDNLRQWQSSEQCHDWIRQSRDMVISEDTQIQQSSGLELWFTLPGSRSTKTMQPPYYKMVIMGVMAVYPLILLVNLLLGPLLGDLPQLLGMFISVIAVSALMSYPVMPWLSQLLRPWLYPKSKR